MKNKIFLLVMAVVFLAGCVSAIPQTLNIHGKLSNSGGALSGTYDITPRVNLIKGEK